MPELAHIVDHYKTLLGLRDWVVEVDTESAEEGHLADILPVYGQRHAKVRVGADWRDWDTDLLHSTIVHELLHCHTEHPGAVAEVTASAISEAAGPVVRAAVDLALEYAVDAIAVAITEHLPPPPPFEPEAAPKPLVARAVDWFVQAFR